MKWVGCGMLVLALALPATWGDDKKEDKPPPTAKEQYDALVKDFTAKQQEILKEARAAKGDDQQKLFQKYSGLGKDFAAKFFKLSEDNAKDPVAADAVFWIIGNASSSDVYAKAKEKVNAIIDEMPIKDLTAKLAGIRGNSTLTDAVLKRADRDEKDPASGDLLGWAATLFPPNEKAIATLIDKYPDNPAIERVCMMVSRGNMANGDKYLRLILEKSTKPKVKTAAALGIGRVLASKTDSLGDKPDESDKVAAEAEKYFAMAIELIGNEGGTAKEAAERELKALRTIRVGKETPEIAAGDLDGKDFKLSDYRGKVVLLDFWGFW